MSDRRQQALRERVTHGSSGMVDTSELRITPSSSGFVLHWKGQHPRMSGLPTAKTFDEALDKAANLGYWPIMGRKHTPQVACCIPIAKAKCLAEELVKAKDKHWQSLGYLSLGEASARNLLSETLDAERAVGLAKLARLEAEADDLRAVLELK